MPIDDLHIKHKHCSANNKYEGYISNLILMFFTIEIAIVLFLFV